MFVLNLKDKFVYSQYIDLCKRINASLSEITKERHVVLDLSEVTFVDPFGMISIIGIGRHMYNRQGIFTTIVLPRGSAGTYMERAGFSSISIQENFIEVKRSTSWTKWLRNTDTGILNFFTNEQEIRSIVEEVERWMGSHGYDESEQSSMSTFISEMVQNVCQHSRSPQRGVLCAQAYRNHKGEHFLAWAIGDAGVGIRQSLLDANVPGIEGMEDSDAIQAVLKGRSSIQDDITRGNGFPNLFKAAQKRRATLFIHSNRGIYGLNMNTSAASQGKLVMNQSPIAGTTVSFIMG